jgi:hypothetical protein
MKSVSFISFCIFIFFFLGSCKKDSSNASSPGSNIKRIAVSYDTVSAVLFIQYNSSNNIISITDSITQNIYTPTYDGSGNLVQIVKSNGGTPLSTIYYTYTGGQLTQIEVASGGIFLRSIYEYSGVVLSKQTDYRETSLGSGGTSIGYEIFTFTEGNVSDIKAYSPSDQLYYEETFTCNTANPNRFKKLGFFNWTGDFNNLLVANIQTFLNSNEITGSSITGTYSSTADYTYNASGQIIKVVTTQNELNPPQTTIVTWDISY